MAMRVGGARNVVLGILVAFSLDAAVGFPVTKGLVGGVPSEGDKLGVVDANAEADGGGALATPSTTKPTTTLRGVRLLTSNGSCPEGQLTGWVKSGSGIVSGIRSALGGDDVSLARGITVYSQEGVALKSWDSVRDVLENPGVHVVPGQVVCVRERMR